MITDSDGRMNGLVGCTCALPDWRLGVVGDTRHMAADCVSTLYCITLQISISSISSIYQYIISLPLSAGDGKAKSRSVHHPAPYPIKFDPYSFMAIGGI